MRFSCMRLFILHTLISVLFLLLLVSGVGCYLWLWHSLDFSINWAATRQNQQHDCAPSDDSDQPGHPPSLFRVFAVRMKKAWVLSYPLNASKDWSDWADAQTDLSLRWGHSHFLVFVVSWSNCFSDWGPGLQCQVVHSFSSVGIPVVL